jgi:aspartyl-tRNA(Asn)/glutamyl-tRNA(Gln) amidotransferase subunit A
VATTTSRPSELNAVRDDLIAGATTCEETTEAELSNIEAYGRRHNAFITVFSGDHGLALSRAREIDARVAGRMEDPAPPLLGVPVTIKDNVFFAGFPTTDGSACFTSFVPAANAAIVDRLLEAGCVPLGKTNQHELALGTTSTSAYGGPILNSSDPARISGGSSGGSAVSVALSNGPLLSVGSDTGGSVRIPAALCGVCGFKPSQGLFATDGVFPLSPSLDHLGLLTKTVPDLSTAFRALTGIAPRARRDRPRLGVPDRYFTEEMDETVSRDFSKSVEVLGSSGEFEVKDVHVEESYAAYSRARAIIQLKEASWFYEELLRSSERRSEMHQDVLTLLDSGLRYGMIEYMRSMDVRNDSLRRIPRLLDGVDVLVMPTCLIVAPRVDEVLGKETGSVRRRLLRNTELFNLTGLPALSLPIRKTDGSMPTALQLVGRHGDDAMVLSVAEAIWDSQRATKRKEGNR